MMYRLKGLIYGVISSATFGLIPLFALPAIRNGIGVDSVMFYRFGISALVLGLWLVIRRYDLRISGRGIVHSGRIGYFLCYDRFVADYFLFVYSEWYCNDDSFSLSGGCDDRYDPLF